MKSLSLEGKSALVTGSSRGIGLGIALGMRESGANVLFHGTKDSEDIPEGATYLRQDLLAPEGAENLMRDAFAAAPDLDILICNAGSFFDTSFLDMTEERWEKTMNLNVRAPYFMIQHFARELVARKRPGSIILISSTNGFQAEDNSSAYDVSKGALVMMTRSLAISLADHDIRVNGVAPGLIRTPLTAGWMDQQPEKIAHYNRKILLRRIGNLEDCAGACVYLASQAAEYVTGQIIVVDGGLTVGQIGKMEK